MSYLLTASLWTDPINSWSSLSTTAKVFRSCQGCQACLHLLLELSFHHRHCHRTPIGWPSHIRSAKRYDNIVDSRIKGLNNNLLVYRPRRTFTGSLKSDVFFRPAFWGGVTFPLFTQSQKGLGVDSVAGNVSRNRVVKFTAIEETIKVAYYFYNSSLTSERDLRKQ